MRAPFHFPDGSVLFSGTDEDPGWREFLGIAQIDVDGIEREAAAAYLAAGRRCGLTISRESPVALILYHYGLHDPAECGWQFWFGGPAGSQAARFVQELSTSHATYRDRCGTRISRENLR